MTDGKQYKPKEVVDRGATAGQLTAIFAAAKPSSNDLGRSEDEIMTAVIAEIDETRRERRLAQMTRAAKAIDPKHSLDLAEEALPLDNESMTLSGSQAPTPK